jgi:hypothetical protein
MDRIDLDEPRFTHDEVLKVIPVLPRKSLQNWTDRDIVRPANPLPGKGNRRLYSGAQLCGLDFMAKITALGIGASDAAPLAVQIAEHAATLHRKYPAKEKDGRLHWIIAGGKPELYHHGAVAMFNGAHRLMIFEPGEDMRDARAMLPDVLIDVAVDYLILGVLNRLYAHLAGVELSAEPAFSADVSETERAEFADLMKSVKQPKTAPSSKKRGKK